MKRAIAQFISIPLMVVWLMFAAVALGTTTVCAIVCGLDTLIWRWAGYDAASGKPIKTEE